MEEFKQCRCGRQPSIRESLQQTGQGPMEKVFWVECACGMQTSVAVEGWQGSADYCKQYVTKIWNNVMDQ